MAAPSYTTDLTTLATGDLIVDAGTWDESTDAAWDDAGSMVDDQNLYYNNSECVSAQFTKDGVGTILYEHTSSVTIPTDGAFLIHHLWAAPPALSTLANGGIRILIGNGFGVFFGWKASGSDFAPAPRGGWTNYALNPGIASPDYTVGSPATPYDTFGIAVAATAQARGNPNACNAVRYGRCTSIYTIGDSSTPATFTGYAVVDDTITNKWNLLAAFEGSFKFQGLMSLGETGTAVYFKDLNKNITITDTINVTAPFNAIEIHNASSEIYWTTIGVTALGTASKGTFEVVDNAIVALTSCTFTDMNTFIFQSNSVLVNTTFRRCGLVTQGSAELDGCLFDKPTGSIGLIVNSLDDLTDCSFVSDDTGHAIDLGTITSSQTITWNNTDSGYTASSSGNETILVNVNSGQTLTISIGTNAGSTPSIYNTGTGTAVTASSVPLSVTVIDSTNTPITTANVRIEETDGTLVSEGAVNGSGIYSSSYTESTPLTIVLKVRSSSSGETRYFPVRTGGTIASSTGLVTTVTMQLDPIVST